MAILNEVLQAFAEEQDYQDPTDTTDYSKMNQPTPSSSPLSAIAKDSPYQTEEKIAADFRAANNFQGTDAQITFKPDGTRVITMNGDGKNKEFQGMGRYATPEAFMKADPQGFRNANPNLVPTMGIVQKNNINPDGAPVVVQTNMSKDIFAGIQTQMDLIGKMDNTLDKSVALGNLRGSMAETAANMQRDMRILAEQQAGVPGLKKQLADREKGDRADPRWGEFLSDSPPTIRIRAELAKAENSALALSKRMISENPTIAFMAVKADNFLTTQERLINNGMIGEAKKKASLEDDALSITPDITANLTRLFPQIANDVMKAAEFKQSVRTDPNKKNLAFLFIPELTDEGILAESFRGNPMAQKLAIDMQAERTGQTKEKVRESLSQANRLVNDEQFFLEQMKKVSLTDTNYATSLSNYTKESMVPGADSIKQRAASRLNIATTLLNKQATAVAVNDVESWTGDNSLRSNPAIAAEMDKLKTLNPGKPINLQALVGSYVFNAPKEQQATRLEEIKKSLTSAVDKSNKGLYGKMDSATMNTILTNSLKQGGISGMLGTLFDGYTNVVANSDIPALQGY